MKHLLSLLFLCLFIFPLTMQAQVMGQFEGDIQSNTLSGST